MCLSMVSLDISEDSIAAISVTRPSLASAVIFERNGDGNACPQEFCNNTEDESSWNRALMYAQVTFPGREKPPTQECSISST